MASIKITKSSVDRLPPLSPGKSQVFYRDSILTGFGIYVGKTSKTYFVERWMKAKGRPVRTTIGKHGVFTPDQARKEAQILLGQMAAGTNPNLQKHANKSERITLQAAYEDYLTTRTNLSDRTKKDYGQAMERAFLHWKKTLITEISKDMVRRRYAKLAGKREKGEKQIKGEKIGAAQANQAMRFLRALFNFSQGQYENGAGHPLVAYNPVDVLTQTRAWQKVPRRRNHIDKEDLPAWFNAAMEIKRYSKNNQTSTICDYLLFILFTGLRRGEAEKLRWEQIDLKKKIFTITDTKNSEPLTLPLSKFIYELLVERKELSSSEFVFPGEGATGHIVETKRQVKNITKISGVKFTIHDLRRTFITIAESLDIPAYALKALLNHKISGGGDVTEGYISITPDRLCAPMQKIANHILFTVGAKAAGKIVALG
jgi:integrase